ncbi:MAG: family 10 glycosylhydrolase [Pseudomonadota bacterium]
MFIFSSYAHAQSTPAWIGARSANSFNRHFITTPRDLEKIIKYDSLEHAIGWFEYDIEIPQTGWYELETLGSGAGVQYYFDIDKNNSTSPWHYYGSNGLLAGHDKIGNVWLTTGPHRVRVERYYWTGFPPISGLILKRSTEALEKTIHVALPSSTRTFRSGACPQMDIYVGRRNRATTMTVKIDNSATRALLSTISIPIAVSDHLTKLQASLPCITEGSYRVTFSELLSAMPQRDVPTLTYEVIETNAPVAATRAPDAALVQDIDCTSVPPDYFDGGATQVIKKQFGAYRESGDIGWTRFQRMPEVLRKIAPNPSWFAYRINGLVPQHGYRVEVDYPDDALRTFAIALREAEPLSYPVAGGVDSGGEFSLTHTMQTHTLYFWPRTSDVRIVFMTAHNRMRAAASRVRIYRLAGDLLPLAPPGGRHFINWYEEGDNYQSMYGVPNADTDAMRDANRIGVERWAKAAGYRGVNVLSPTVSIYHFSLYPSRFNLTFTSSPHDDSLQRILLMSEKYGLKVLPEIHPRADELAWPNTDTSHTAANLLVNKNGETNYFSTDKKKRNYPPYYNPVFPANQDWYVGMVGELADRFKDSPALLGINLRQMNWVNASLNNFVSLDWGYDDFTVALFQQDTGIKLPATMSSDAPFPLVVKARVRYKWLMSHAREQWIAWRCNKIAQLYARIRDRIQLARPDLKLFSSVFARTGSSSGHDALRGAGIDPRLLTHIKGVVLINALHTYGRRDTLEVANRQVRDQLVDANNLHALYTPPASGAFLNSANYLEATGVVATNVALGFPASTKTTWTSAAATPAGRHFLERYAIQLAETDATWLGDGGNAYSLGQAELGDFMREYRALPDTPFSLRADARDPIAVWELRRAHDYLFYAVNRERYRVKIQIQIQGSGAIRRLSNGEYVARPNGVLELDLMPYQLLAFIAPETVAISTIITFVSPEIKDLIKIQVQWLTLLRAEIEGQVAFPSLNKHQRMILKKYATETGTALRHRQWWRARALLENHELLDIYDTLNRRPPKLRNNDS